MDTQHKNFKSLTLKQLVYALAAGDHGNVTAAARQLNVSQPAVSSAIAALERHYGMKLFSRQPAQGVTLTPFGIKVISEARLLCDQAQTVASLATPDAQISGEVSLYCYEAIAPNVLPRLLRRVNERLPDVTIRFVETDLEGAASALSSGRADLAVTYDLGLSNGLRTQTLYTLQPRVICSTDHRFAAYSEVALADLHGENVILLDQPLSSQYVIGLLRASSAVPVVVARVKSLELQRSLVANGFGVALAHTLPNSNTAHDGRQICNLPVADDLMEQQVLLACTQQSENRPILKAIQTELIAEFANAQRYSPSPNPACPTASA